MTRQHWPVLANDAIVTLFLPTAVYARFLHWFYAFICITLLTYYKHKTHMKCRSRTVKSMLYLLLELNTDLQHTVGRYIALICAKIINFGHSIAVGAVYVSPRGEL